jgi:hypothetical protein
LRCQALQREPPLWDSRSLNRASACHNTISLSDPNIISRFALFVAPAMASPAPLNSGLSIHLTSETGSSCSLLQARSGVQGAASALLPVPDKHYTNTVSGDAAPAVVSKDNGAEADYDLAESLDSVPGNIQPLSRRPTQIDFGRGDPVRNISTLEASQEETEMRLERAMTSLGFEGSAPGSSSRPDRDPAMRPLRSQTEADLQSGKSKRDKGKDLGDRIATAMERLGDIGLDDPRSYMPAEMLAQLINCDTVKKAMKKPVSEQVLDFAVQNPKVFAIICLVFSDREHRRRAMEAFEEYNFTDACLPADKLSSQEICPVQFDWDDSSSEKESEDSEPSDKLPRCEHRPEAAAFHRNPWRQSTFVTFWEKQWSFLIENILEEKFEYQFRDRSILPFIYRRSEVLGGGHFGDILPALMLAKYQNAIPTVRCS